MDGGDSADNSTHDDSVAAPVPGTAPIDGSTCYNSEAAALGDLSPPRLNSDSLGLEFVDPQWTTASFDELSMPLSLAGDGQFSSILFGDIDFAFDSPSDDTSSRGIDSGTGAHSQDTTSSADASCTSSSPEGHQGSESFPDSYLLPVNELKLMRAALRVADRLNAQSLWDLTASSPFNLGTNPPADQLPLAWQPTTSQLLVPHHPVIDLLPWPSCRDRILDVLSLPDDARPPTARGALALVNFIYDLEDSAEGIRIWGSDPYDEKGWEVGQVVFERWWFIFDRDVVERSNHWRRLRGAPVLRISGNTGAVSTAGQRVTEV